MYDFVLDDFVFDVQVNNHEGFVRKPRQFHSSEIHHRARAGERIAALHLFCQIDPANLFYQPYESCGRGSEIRDPFKLVLRGVQNGCHCAEPLYQLFGNRLYIFSRDRVSQKKLEYLKSDRVLITSDNPRSEDPLAIIDAIRRGAPGAEVEPDRAHAIEKVVSQAQRSDVVLIAGKGHENYQEIAGKRSHFSDEEQARAAIARRAQ